MPQDRCWLICIISLLEFDRQLFVVFCIFIWLIIFICPYMICVLPITSKKTQLQNTLPWIFHFSNTGGFTQGDKEGKIYELKKQNQARLLKLWWLWCVLFIKVADVSPIHFRNQAATDGTKPKDLNIGETPRVWRREIQGQIFCLLADPGNLGVFSLCMEWSGQSKIRVVCVNDGIWQWNFETTKPNHSSWMCETVNLLQYLKTHKDETYRHCSNVTRDIKNGGLLKSIIMP